MKGFSVSLEGECSRWVDRFFGFSLLLDLNWGRDTGSYPVVVCRWVRSPGWKLLCFVKLRASVTADSKNLQLFVSTCWELLARTIFIRPAAVVSARRSRREGVL